MDLSTNLSLTHGDNVNFYKSIQHSIYILPAGIGKTLKIFKTNK